MVLKYYNLSLRPFGVTPDTTFLFLAGLTAKRLASLMYGQILRNPVNAQQAEREMQSYA